MPSRSQRKREGVIGGTSMRLPHREQEWYGARVMEWNAMATSQQLAKKQEVTELMMKVGLTKKITTAGAAAAPLLVGEDLIVLAIFAKICGKVNAEAFLTDFKVSDRSRKGLTTELVREAFRFATAATVGPVVDNTVTFAEIRREKEAEEAAAAEAARVAAFVPPVLTPHMTMAYGMGMAAESLRLSADCVDQEILESGRKLAVKIHWNRIFVLLVQKVADLRVNHLEHLIDVHVNYQLSLNDADAEYRKLWFCPMPTGEWERARLIEKRGEDTESWANINEVEAAVKSSYRRCAFLDLMIRTGIHILMRKWWKQPMPRAAAMRAAAPKKHIRLTTAEKEQLHTAVVRKLKANELTAKVIVPVKPLEQIHTIVIKNLPEVNRVSNRDLNSAIRRLVGNYGGKVREGLGGVYIPMAGHSSKGFCFVELVNAENARSTLVAMGESVELEFGGVVSELAPSLALSNRKSKEEMEAEKVKAKATTVDAVSAAIKSAMRGPGAELKPICLADIKREKISAAEQALKDKIAQSFPALGDSTASNAKHFEVSFAAAAAKPLPEKVVVVDPFKVSVKGIEYALAAAPNTEIGKAQMALRQAAADVIAAEERRLARASKRSEMVEDKDTHWLVEKVAEVKPVLAEKKVEVKYRSFQEEFRAHLAEVAGRK